jgi:DNA-binding FadR family transcriptional regulator
MQTLDSLIAENTSLSADLTAARLKIAALTAQVAAQEASLAQMAQMRDNFQRADTAPTTQSIGAVKPVAAQPKASGAKKPSLDEQVALARAKK